jgi:hypothetical protein
MITSTTNPARSDRGRAVKLALAAVLIVAAAALLFWRARGSGPGYAPGSRQFLTVDDGKTWFLDSSSETAPVVRDGITAYELVLITCDGGKTKWPGYLLRYTPAGKQLLVQVREQMKAGRPPEMMPQLQMETEIKRPGARDWVRMSDAARYNSIIAAASKCPHGGAHETQVVTP